MLDWRMRWATSALLLLLAVLTDVGTDARLAWGQAPQGVADIEAAVLATRTLVEVPTGRRWVLRVRHPMDEDAGAHAGGFIYAADGQSTLVVEESQGIIMEQGRAAWAPEDIAHLHRSQIRSSGQTYGASAPGVEIWTILLERPAEARQPGARAMSPPLSGLQSGPYEARLMAETYQPGASTALRRRTGPELAYLLDGSWELTYDGVPFPLGAGDGYLADPQVPHRLRNVGTATARLLSAQLIPEGRPAEEPAP